jgi:hypothetical protein
MWPGTQERKKPIYMCNSTKAKTFVLAREGWYEISHSDNIHETFYFRDEISANFLEILKYEISTNSKFRSTKFRQPSK